MRRSYGFDPFGLGSVPSNLQRFQEAELVHSRWAMAGVAGALAAELLGQGDWYEAPSWVSLFPRFNSTTTLPAASPVAVRH